MPNIEKATREDLRQIGREALDGAQTPGPGAYEVFCPLDATGNPTFPPEIVPANTVEIAKLNEAYVNGSELPSGLKAGKALYVGAIKHPALPSQDWNFSTGPIRL